MHVSLIALIALAPAPYALEAPIADVGRAGVATATATAAADSVPAWFRHHLESLAGGSGQWTADNAEFKSEAEPWDAYGLEWTWGLGHRSVKGRLYVIRDGKDAGSLFEYWILWDPGARQAMLIQYGSDGTYGVGVIEPDGTDGTAVEQTFYQPDGATTRVKHTDRHTGDVRVVQSFDWVDGAWRPRRLYHWKQAPVPAGPDAERSDAASSQEPDAQATLGPSVARGGRAMTDARRR